MGDLQGDRRGHVLQAKQFLVSLQTLQFTSTLGLCTQIAATRLFICFSTLGSLDLLLLSYILTSSVFYSDNDKHTYPRPDPQDPTTPKVGTMNTTLAQDPIILIESQMRFFATAYRRRKRSFTLCASFVSSFLLTPKPSTYRQRIL